MHDVVELPLRWSAPAILAPSHLDAVVKELLRGAVVDLPDDQPRTAGEEGLGLVLVHASWAAVVKAVVHPLHGVVPRQRVIARMLIGDNDRARRHIPQYPLHHSPVALILDPNDLGPDRAFPWGVAVMRSAALAHHH